MRRGAKPYTPPARTAEDDRSLLNWLSMRVADDGKDCHPDHQYERVLVEYRLRLARRLKLTMQPGVYLPRLEQSASDPSHVSDCQLVLGTTQTQD